jgi:hypothetical protein
MRIEIITGIGEDASGIPLLPREQADATDHVLAQSSSLFGGVSATHGIGAWLNPAGKLVKELNLTLVVHADGADAHAKAEQLAEIVREAFRQHSVLLTASETIAAPQFITSDDAIAVG